VKLSGVVLGKPKLKKSLGRPRHKCENNIKKNIKETKWEGCNLIHLIRDREKWWDAVNRVLNHRVP
jgi:hypothetical protein